MELLTKIYRWIIRVNKDSCLDCFLIFLKLTRAVQFGYINQLRCLHATALHLSTQRLTDRLVGACGPTNIQPFACNGQIRSNSWQDYNMSSPSALHLPIPCRHMLSGCNNELWSCPIQALSPPHSEVQICYPYSHFSNFPKITIEAVYLFMGSDKSRCIYPNHCYELSRIKLQFHYVVGETMRKFC